MTVSVLFPSVRVSPINARAHVKLVYLVCRARVKIVTSRELNKYRAVKHVVHPSRDVRCGVGLARALFARFRCEARLDRKRWQKAYSVAFPQKLPCLFFSLSFTVSNHCEARAL